MLALHCHASRHQHALLGHTSILLDPPELVQHPAELGLYCRSSLVVRRRRPPRPLLNVRLIVPRPIPSGRGDSGQGNQVVDNFDLKKIVSLPYTLIYIAIWKGGIIARAVPVAVKMKQALARVQESTPRG